MGLLNALFGAGDTAGCSDREMRAAARTNRTADAFNANLLHQLDNARREAGRRGTPQAKQRYDEVREAQRRWNEINFK